MYQVPLEMICRHDRTAEVCRAAVEEDGWQLENVPEELKTPELCRKALETEAGFGNDFHRGLVQHIPSPEVCMEVLKECRENNPEELYGVAVAIRPEVMNGEMADFLLPLDGRCIPCTCKRRSGCGWRWKRRGCPPSGVAECRKACSRPRCMSGAPPTAGSR